MPYAIKKQGNVWITYNKETGESKGKHDSREKAMKQLRLLSGIEHGMKVRSQKK